jgi:hypothetical protein
VMGGVTMMLHGLLVPALYATEKDLFKDITRMVDGLPLVCFMCAVVLFFWCVAR